MSVEQEASKSLSPEAVAQLVEGHREFLAFLERRVESREAAEDILQTAFVRGWSAAPMYRMKTLSPGSIEFSATRSSITIADGRLLRERWKSGDVTLSKARRPRRS